VKGQGAGDNLTLVLSKENPGRAAAHEKIPDLLEVPVSPD